MTEATLDELDWCLDTLEEIQSGRSVGDLATSKFERMLDKQLSLFPDSKSGSQITGYIRSFLGKYLSTHTHIPVGLLVFSCGPPLISASNQAN